MPRILIIEDEVNILENWLEFLQLQGYKCVGVTTGKDALKKLSNQHFDLVLSDIKLPDIDGFTIKSKLNNDQVRIPLIFISAHALKDGIIKSRQLGAVSFLAKPISNNDLLEAVQKSLTYSRFVHQKPEFLEPIAKLKITQQDESMEIFISRAYTVGRSKNSDIVLFSPQASREHGIFTRIYDEPDNKSFYKIVDYSQNGISVNGKRVIAYENLKHGYLVEFPGCLIEYFELGKTTDIDPYKTST